MGVMVRERGGDRSSVVRGSGVEGERVRVGGVWREWEAVGEKG